MRFFLLTILSLFVVTAHGRSSVPKYIFKCYPEQRELEPLYLVLEGTNALLNEEKGTFDESYSGGHSEKYDRFIGYSGPEGEHMELLVEKKLRQGDLRGNIRIQVRGETFYVNAYRCYSRNKILEY